MEKELFKEMPRMERIQVLKDNASVVCEKSYMKPYSPEELQGHKENLTNLALEIREVNDELKLVKEEFKGRLKPLQERYAKMLDNIKAKAEMVTEECYGLTDNDERVTAFYNADGDRIEERNATYDELAQMFKANGEARLAM